MDTVSVFQLDARHKFLFGRSFLIPTNQNSKLALDIYHMAWKLLWYFIPEGKEGCGTYEGGFDMNYLCKEAGSINASMAIASLNDM